MEYSTFILIFLFHWAQALGSESNDIIFQHIGTTTTSCTYAHLSIDLRFEVFKNQTEAMAQLLVLSHSTLNELRDKHGMKTGSMVRDFGGLPATIKAVARNLNTYAYLLDHASIKLSSRRTKRQLLGIGSLALGLYNSYELERLNEKFSNVESEIDLVIHNMELEDLKVNHLQSEVKSLNSVVAKLLFSYDKTQIYLAQQSLLYNLTSIVTQYKNEMDDYIEALQFLTQQKLSPLLMKPNTLKESFEKIVALGREKNLRPLYDDYTLMFHSQASSIMNGTHLTAILHIPMVGGESLSLYKFVNTPFLVNNLTMEVDLHDTVLAINEANTVFKVMREESLLDCVKFGQTYHCENNNVVNKNVSRSCLFTLFSQQLDALKNRCNLLLSSPEESVIQLDESTYRLLVPKNQLLTVTCSNGTTTSRKIQGSLIINLQPGCHATMDSYYITHDSTIRTSASLRPQLVNLDLHHVINLDDLQAWEMDAQEFVQSVNDISKALDRPVALGNLRQQISDLRQMNQTAGHTTILKFAILTIALILLALVAVYINLKCRNRLSCCPKNKTRGPAAGHHRNREMDIYETLNRDQNDG